MSNRRITHAFVLCAALAFSSLACRAAMNLVYTPTSAPPAASLPPPLTPTETPVTAADAVCRTLLDDVLDTARYGGDADNSGSLTGSDPELLATYRVQGDRISLDGRPPVPDTLLDQQQDTQAHRRIWEYFVALIPAEDRWMVNRFILITDGPEEILGGVVQTNEPDLWALEMDLLDAADPHTLTYTLVHEFGHLLTLNATQVPPSEDLFQNPEVDEIYEREAAACDQYFPGEGCSLPISYLNVFFDRFWTDLYDEWLEIDLIVEDDLYEDRLLEFYRHHRDNFVTDYAPTSPSEDIAEAWTFFILASRPDGDGIADQKIRFFYEYPKLVRLREAILGSLCEAFPRQ